MPLKINAVAEPLRYRRFVDAPVCRVQFDEITLLFQLGGPKIWNASGTEMRCATTCGSIELGQTGLFPRFGSKSRDRARRNLTGNSFGARLCEIPLFQLLATGLTMVSLWRDHGVLTAFSMRSMAASTEHPPKAPIEQAGTAQP